jgi:general secretion pathway protein G
MVDRSRFANVAMILLLAFCGISLPRFKIVAQVQSDRHPKVEADIMGLSTQLKLYQSMNGFFPTTEQGLHALVEEPNTSPRPHRWYQTFEHLPKDPWGNDYVYRCPGTKHPSAYDLFSPGPDHKPDTADDDWGL